MPAYYPSLVVNIKLRFDEQVVTELALASDPLSPDDMADANDGAPTPGTDPTLTRTTPPFSFVMNRVPTHCSCDLPGYRQAATFDMELMFKDLPIDPQTVRAAAVEIYLGAVPAKDFASVASFDAVAGIFGRKSVLRTRDVAGQLIKDNLLMVGSVDEWSVTHGDKMSVCKLKGRDLRGMLIDTPVATSPSETEKFFAKIDMAEDIVGVVQAILSMHPLFAEIKVVCNPEEWPDNEIPSPASDAAIPRHRKGAKGNKKSRSASSGKGSASELHFWDLIVRECYLVGAIPYFNGLELLIRPSRSIFDQKRAGIDPGKNPTPFKGGKKRDFDAVSKDAMDALSVRKLVYGRDIKEVTFDRKYGGYRRPKIVRAITVDQSAPTRGQDRTLTAQWPPESKTKAQTTRVSPGADASQTEYLNIPVAGIRDKEQLLEIAKAVFEEIGRGEMGGSCELVNLASFGGDNDDPDMLKLKPGDGVEFGVDTRQLTQSAPLIATFTDSQRQPLGKVIKQLSDIVGDQLLAKTIAVSSRSARAQRFFRVQNVKYDWSNTSGIKIHFDFQNYVVARNEAGTVSTSDGSVVKRKVPKKVEGFGL